MHEDTAIKVKDVSKTFNFNSQRGISKILSHSDSSQQKTFKALDGISFRVIKGEVLGIIGLNGSGKTTLLRIIAGVYKPDHGSVEISGKLSPLMQLGAGFQGDLAVEENIILNGMLLGISKSDIQSKVYDIIHYAELEKFVNMKLKYLSTGMRARLAFSIAMQIDHEILLVDEILSVGDKDFQKKSYETFLTLTQKKKTILHTSHNLKKIREISDRILLLDNGKVVTIGEPQAVIQRYREMKSGN